MQTIEQFLNTRDPRFSAVQDEVNRAIGWVKDSWTGDRVDLGKPVMDYAEAVGWADLLSKLQKGGNQSTAKKLGEAISLGQIIEVQNAVTTALQNQPRPTTPATPAQPPKPVQPTQQNNQQLNQQRQQQNQNPMDQLKEGAKKKRDADLKKFGRG